MPVLKEPAGSTLEVVPSFERLHATDHRLQIDQGMITVGTPQRGRRNLGVPRHGCRSHQVWSTTLAGCGGILTHTGHESNRLAASTAEKSCAFCGRGVHFRGSRCPSEVTLITNLSPPATFRMTVDVIGDENLGANRRRGPRTRRRASPVLRRLLRRALGVSSISPTQSLLRSSAKDDQ